MQLGNGIYYSTCSLKSSTCFERYVAHHQELQLYLQPVVYIRVWWPPVVKSEWEQFPLRLGLRPFTTHVCKPEAANTVGAPDDERHTARNMLSFLMNKWNNKFRYQVASCWLFILSYTTMHGSMNIKLVTSVYYGVIPSHNFHTGDSPVLIIVPTEG